MDVKEEGLIKGDIGAHWYYRAKLSALLRMISDLRPSSVLDVGAGLGFFARSLLAETAITEATCIDPAYRVERCTMVGGKKLWFRPTINSSDAELVLMMDVIEHVADDVGLVAEYRFEGERRHLLRRYGACLHVALEWSRCLSGTSSSLHLVWH